MIPNIKNHKIIICGLQGSGKTYFSKKIVRELGLKCLVFSPHRHDFIKEPDNFIFYSNSTKDNIEDFCRQAIQLGKKGLINCVLIDEFDMLFKNNFDVGKNATDIFANHRHYGLAIIGITRRPQDIPTYFVESAKYVVSFSIQGENARKKFNNLYRGMGDMVIEDLTYKNYDFVIKKIAEPPKIVSQNKDKGENTEKNINH